MVKEGSGWSAGGLYLAFLVERERQGKEGVERDLCVEQQREVHPL